MQYTMNLIIQIKIHSTEVYWHQLIELLHASNQARSIDNGDIQWTDRLTENKSVLGDKQLQEVSN